MTTRITHITGTLRVDGYAGVNEPQWDNLFRSAHWREPTSFDKCNMPCGKEGSIQYSVKVNDDPNDTARYIVTFWGDLVEFGNENDVYNVYYWFQRVVKKLDLIRQGILLVSDSFNKNSCILTVTGNNSVKSLRFTE